MAKSKKRPAPKKGKAAKKAKGKKAKPARRARPEQQRLLDDMPKSRRLDRICKSMSAALEALNEARNDVKGLQGSALLAMREEKATVYKAHGVELIHVHGDDKIRARKINDDTGGEDDEKIEEARDAAEAGAERVEEHTQE